MEKQRRIEIWLRINLLHFSEGRPREGGMELLLPGREKSQRIRRAVEVENNHQGSCVWILLMKFAGPHWLLLEEAPT